MAPSCALDEDGLREQRERYRKAGRGARIIERHPRLVVVELDASVDTVGVERLLAVERECCPFFELSWEPTRRRLAVGVSAPEYEPAIGAIVAALGLEG